MDRIMRSRKRAGLTQQQLAEVIGVQRSVISKYENGVIAPSIAQISRIAAVLNVSEAYLIEDYVDSCGCDKTISSRKGDVRKAVIPKDALTNWHEREIRKRASPCPFCGHDRIKFSRHCATGQDRGTKLVRIICARCKCGTNYEKTLHEAEAAWNHRPNERMK